MTLEFDATAGVSAHGVPYFEAHPRSGGPYPCFVVLHERYGLVEHTMDLARRLAGDGHHVLAPNLFYEYEDQDALRLGTASTRIRDERAMEILDDIVGLFPLRPGTDDRRLGMLGACATGRYPVLYGANRPLAACVVLHGLYPHREWEPDGKLHLEPMADLVKRLDAPFLGMFGELDNLVSVDDVRFIRDRFEDADRTYDIICFAGAPHGWMNSTMPARFRPDITEASWAELLAYLRRAFALGDRDRTHVSWRFELRKHVDYDFSKNVGLR